MPRHSRDEVLENELLYFHKSFLLGGYGGREGEKGEGRDCYNEKRRLGVRLHMVDKQS